MPEPHARAPRDVLITGIGLVTPLGDTLSQCAAALYGSAPVFTAVATQHARAVPGARVASDVDAGLSRGEAQLADRSVRLALRAADRALLHAGFNAALQPPPGCGVYVGCGSGPTESLHAVYSQLLHKGRMSGLALLRCLPSGAAAAVALRHGLRGPVQTYANACAASATALGEALRAIRHSYLDVALAGGTEAPFGDATVRAWEALRVLAPLDEEAPAQACRPFDRRRRGLALGEGAVFFVLEAAEHAAARGAPVLARLAGFGASGDGSHATEPRAEGQADAMRAALHDARLQPQHIGAINAHGTATPVGDRVEAESIASVFGPPERAPWVSATKATHGHLLGASGAIELAMAVLTLHTRRAPPTRHAEEPDPACAVRLAVAPAPALSADCAVLSNSFAFGGSNACLVVTA